MSWNPDTDRYVPDDDRHKHSETPPLRSVPQQPREERPQQDPSDDD